MKRQKVCQLTRTICILLGGAVVLFASASTPAFATDDVFGHVAFVDISGGGFQGSGQLYSRDFGTVSVNQCSSVAFFEIRHDPQGETHKLRVSSLDVVGDNPGDFKVTTESATVGGWFNGNIVIKVQFCPTHAGVRKATIGLAMWHVRVDQQGEDWIKNVPEFQLIGKATDINPTVKDPPDLRNGWYSNSSSEAQGGMYNSTFNTRVGAVSTATWEGQLPQGQGNYKVEVFIPRQPSGGSSTPRTDHAVYRIFHAGAGGQAIAAISQNVTASDWVSLGTFAFQGTYRIVLTDETGEPDFSHSVVADAVRLTPAP